MSIVSDDSESFVALPLETSNTDSLSSRSTEDDSSPQVSFPSKRKSSSSDWAANKNPRLSQYNSNFHQLYNDTVNKVNYPAEADENLPWNPGRIGLSYWSAHEKEIFFIALDRKGPDDIKGISSLVGTKSEPEVRNFILALQDGLAEWDQAVRPLSEIPAAFEVGQQCDAALDAASIGLSKRQLGIEEATEKRRHAKWWLLDYDTAVALEDVLSEDQLPASCEQVEIAARLFDIPSMIQLSTLLFMNSKDPEWNWRTWLGDKSGPGLYGTTLVDFYNLVAGITKRVISSSIFLAESRHQLQSEALGRISNCVVKHRDVQAALEILGLKKNRWADRIKIARRCNLEVYRTPVIQRTKQQPLTYEQVEQYLAAESRQTAKDHFRAMYGSNIAVTGGIAVRHGGNHFVEETEDDRTELLDAIASKEEEIRLWKIIGQDSPDLANVKKEEEMTLPRASMDKDRVAEDWRKTINYRSPWQSKIGVPPERLFTDKVAVQSKHHINEIETSSDNDMASLLSDDLEERLSEVDDSSVGTSDEP